MNTDMLTCEEALERMSQALDGPRPLGERRGRGYCWLTGACGNEEPDAEDTDEWALRNKYVSVVPVQPDLTDYRQMRNLGRIFPSAGGSDPESRK